MSVIITGIFLRDLYTWKVSGWCLLHYKGHLLFAETADLLRLDVSLDATLTQCQFCVGQINILYLSICKQLFFLSNNISLLLALCTSSIMEAYNNIWWPNQFNSIEAVIVIVVGPFPFPLLFLFWQNRSTQYP